jgi:prepilin-type N-terminal cleavage/methylation domain-containing protein
MSTHDERYHGRMREKGFTLVEIMIAICILSIVVLSVASLQNSSLLVMAKSNAVTQATNVAMDRMERLLALPYNTWSTTGLYGARPYPGDDTFPLFVNLPDMPSEVTNVTFTVDDGTTANTLIIMVMVEPKGPKLMKTVTTLTGIKTQL